MILVLTFLTTASAEDSVIAMQLSGGVEVRAEPQRAVVLFERLPEGTTLVLEDGAVAQLLYPDGGRLERWTGPSQLEVGSDHSTSASDPVVAEWTPPSLAARGETLSRMLPGDARGGHTLVRGDDVLPDAQVAQVVRTAREQYAAWTERLGPHDIVAELALAAACLGVGANDEAMAALAEARQRCPGCSGIDSLMRAVSDAQHESSSATEAEQDAG